MSSGLTIHTSGGASGEFRTPAQHILHQLEGADLRPSPTVNALFSELVDLALYGEPADQWLTAEEHARLRTVCGIGETYLEHHWAATILADPSQIKDFPYLRNYQDMVGSEVALLSNYLPAGSRIAFLGSGPLPLTAVLLGQHDYHLDLIDRDKESLDQGAAVINTLHNRHLFPLQHPNTMHVHHADAEQTSCDTVDAVIMAALVGENEADKPRIADALAATMRPGTILAVRSVPDDGRRLLYPRMPEIASDRLELLKESVPPEGVINSLVAYRVR